MENYKKMHDETYKNIKILESEIEKKTEIYYVYVRQLKEFEKSNISDAIKKFQIENIKKNKEKYKLELDDFHSKYIELTEKIELIKEALEAENSNEI